ncbi:MAG: aminoglycoside phosphotransferase family protein [Rudaea sp.]
MPDARAAARLDFVHRHLPAGAGIAAASADASFRSYWRIEAAGVSRILMDAPPDKEGIGTWLDVATRLRTAAVHAPQVFAADPATGFVLMEDLGARTYLPELNAGTVAALYADAFVALLRMQTTADAKGLPDYDRARLVAEMELMPEWFIQRHLGYALSCAEWDILEAAFTRLVHSAQEQPQRFVHRDYHSRNLMIVPDANPGIIDFQDAVRGPITYDLVSLLRDCYAEWPAALVDAWLDSYRQRLVAANITDANAGVFKRWFDWMGLQRHLKVLGIFCRLWYRDGKAAYLRNLPLTLRYVLDVTDCYAEFAELAALLRRAIGARDITQSRADAATAEKA